MGAGEVVARAGGLGSSPIEGAGVLTGGVAGLGGSVGLAGFSGAGGWPSQLGSIFGGVEGGVVPDGRGAGGFGVVSGVEGGLVPKGGKAEGFEAVGSTGLEGVSGSGGLGAVVSSGLNG